MPKTKEELMLELCEMQNFIDACETARTFKLGLDEATYDKYHNAVERQKELVEILDAMEDQRLSIRTVAQFRRKEPVLQQDECEIEKVVELSREEFHHFKNNLLEDYDFISENSDLMCVDKTGTIHCILVLGDDYDEGILVNSEGCAYARYSALLPNARSFIEQQIGQESKMTLWQLMSCGLEDVHLVDVDEEHDLATIVELNQGSLSVAGRSAWGDVLSAKVEGIFEGCYGTHIAVSGCDPQRLADFSFMLAGHCDAEDYDTWVNKHDQEQDIGPVLSMYGSNLNIRQMQMRCPTAKLYAVGEIKDYELQFKGMPDRAFASIAPQKGSSVPAAVWKIQPMDEWSLDRYEGYPNHYFKETVPVQIGEKSVEAMVYIMNLKMDFGVPTDFYYKTVRQGYKDCGLDTDVLDEAVYSSMEKFYSSLDENDDEYFSEDDEEQESFGMEM